MEHGVSPSAKQKLETERESTCSANDFLGFYDRMEPRMKPRTERCILADATLRPGMDLKFCSLKFY